MAGIDASRVINGTFGYVYLDGNWLASFNEAEARVEHQKEELKLCGDRWVRHKLVGCRGTGSIRGFKVTSDLVKLNEPMRDNTKGAVRCELIFKLADPEAYGYERVRLKNVMFDINQLARFTAGELVREELDFTFEDYELLDVITAS